MGAKAWLVGGGSGDGGERFRWAALSRAPHMAEKYSPLWRFTNFRAAWVPPPMQDRVTCRGTRETMEARATDLAKLAVEFRKMRQVRGGNRTTPQRPVPSPEVASAMLTTAAGADLDEIATLLGHEPRLPAEPDADFRRRMGG